MTEPRQKAAMAFSLLERVLACADIARQDELQPIAFAVGGVVWTFDAHRNGPLFAPEDRPDAALRVHCSTRALLGLFAPTPIEPDPADLELEGERVVLDRLLVRVRAHYAGSVPPAAEPGPRTWRNAS